ncbi:MAG TPA: phospholipase D-like domain-containing protein [Rhodospirillales bacterium]|nr:phospholipase D-like domain-containing protein [Rhodospirillales bacterium]
MIDVFTPLWPPLLAALQIGLAALASVHAVLYKRDVRAAIGWIGLIWLVPFGGAMLYALFGINRIRRRASEMRARRTPGRPPDRISPQAGDAADQRVALPAGVAPSPALPAGSRHLLPVAHLLDRIAAAPLTSGNAILPLPGGSRAYAAMLAAIDGATRTVGLATYIFDHDEAGLAFVDALSRAAGRGVCVRVLIDGVGARYSRPSIIGALRARGIRAAEFLPSLFPMSIHYANLRNHRKILVADGRIGFTGGMNIRDGHSRTNGPSAIDDIQFRVEGPVVAHLTETFAVDWGFVTGETLDGDGWLPPLNEAGPVLARGIAAGPDEAFEQVRWTIHAALSQAKRCVRIVTPYFLPDSSLSSALQLAALRGVGVDIVMPEVSNLRLMQWATRAKLHPFAARGCRLWLTPPPFDHAKLMTVDGAWSLIGSANWDQRSLRLNFEFDVECYDAAFAAELDRLIDARLARARLLDSREIESRPLPFRIRDSAAWLLSPYL